MAWHGNSLLFNFTRLFFFSLPQTPNHRPIGNPFLPIEPMECDWTWRVSRVEHFVRANHLVNIHHYKKKKVRGDRFGEVVPPHETSRVFQFFLQHHYYWWWSRFESAKKKIPNAWSLMRAFKNICNIKDINLALMSDPYVCMSINLCFVFFYHFGLQNVSEEKKARYISPTLFSLSLCEVSSNLVVSPVRKRPLWLVDPI